MKIQVLLSVYNGEKFLKEQIDSVLNQKDVTVDLLVRDDGSTDNSLNILANYPDIKVIKGENIGVIASFYELLIQSNKNCDYFAFCDQDDFWETEKLSRAISFLSNDETPRLYCSNTKLVNEKLDFIQNSQVQTPSKSSAMFQNIVIGCTSVFNQTLRNMALAKIPDYSKIRMHDSWIYKIAVFFGETTFDNEPHILYRQHENNEVGTSNTFLKRIIKSIADGKTGIYLEELEEFQKLWGKELSASDYFENNRYLISKKNIITRINYALHPYIKKNSIIKDLWFRIQYIMNWV